MSSPTWVGQEGSEAQTGVQEHYRVGRTPGRTLYRDDQLIGLLHTAEIAQQCADALNQYEWRQRVVAEAPRADDTAVLWRRVIDAWKARLGDKPLTWENVEAMYMPASTRRPET